MANLVKYDDTGYNSLVDTNDADDYFETRLGADEWADCGNQEAALITAFGIFHELDFTPDFDLTDSDILALAQKAQCEQALHMIKHDLDEQPLKQLGLGGLLQITSDSDHDISYLAPRAAGFLREYLIRPGVQRIR